MKTHKQLIKIVKDGHCPIFALCGDTSDELSLTTIWKNVSCKKCKEIFDDALKQIECGEK